MRLRMGAGGIGGDERLLDKGRGHDRIALAVVARLADGEAHAPLRVLRDQIGLHRRPAVIVMSTHGSSPNENPLPKREGAGVQPIVSATVRRSWSEESGKPAPSRAAAGTEGSARKRG